VKKHLLCRADELHFALEVFFRENPGWQDSYVAADKEGVYGIRIDWEENVPYVNKKIIYMVGKNNS